MLGLRSHSVNRLHGEHDQDLTMPNLREYVARDRLFAWARKRGYPGGWSGKRFRLWFCEQTGSYLPADMRYWEAVQRMDNVLRIIEYEECEQSMMRSYGVR